MSKEDHGPSTSELYLNWANARKLKVEAEKLEYEMRWTLSKDAQRIYHFNDPVMDASVEIAIEVVTRWLAFDGERPITVVFNSPGGSVFSGFGLYDFLVERIASGAHIETRVMGCAASMAAVLMQAGKVRTMTPNSYMMLHEASTVAKGASSSIRDQANLVEELQDRTLSILAGRSSLTVEELDARTSRRDWWLAAEECLRHGLVDKIVVP